MMLFDGPHGRGGQRTLTEALESAARGARASTRVHRGARSHGWEAARGASTRPASTRREPCSLARRSACRCSSAGRCNGPGRTSPARSATCGAIAALEEKTRVAAARACTPPTLGGAKLVELYLRAGRPDDAERRDAERWRRERKGAPWALERPPRATAL